jgi:DNA-binding phage protein
MRALEIKDVIRLLRAEIERAGGGGPWARAAGIDRTHVNRMLNGDRPISKKVIRALKLRVVYLPSDTKRPSEAPRQAAR